MTDSKSFHTDRDALWRELAAQAQKGERGPYNQLLREIAPYIRNAVIGRLASPDWADDITQDVLISVHKSLATYSPDRPFTPWLAAIISFRRTDFLRRHYAARDNRRASLDDAEFLKTHVTNPDHAGEYKDVEKALVELPEGQRKVFELVKIQGHSAKDVAREMGMSVSAVKVSAHRTLAKLKEKLG